MDDITARYNSSPSIYSPSELRSRFPIVFETTSFATKRLMMTAQPGVGNPLYFETCRRDHDREHFAHHTNFASRYIDACISIHGPKSNWHGMGRSLLLGTAWHLGSQRGFRRCVHTSLRRVLRQQGEGWRLCHVGSKRIPRPGPEDEGPDGKAKKLRNGLVYFVY